MTDEEVIEETWEPWQTELYCNPAVSDGEGSYASNPFTVYAASFGDAKRTVMTHFGWLLRQHGFHPAWLKEN